MFFCCDIFVVENNFISTRLGTWINVFSVKMCVSVSMRKKLDGSLNVCARSFSISVKGLLIA